MFNTNDNVQDMTVGDLQGVIMQAMGMLGPGMNMGAMGGFGTGFAPTAGRMQQMQFELMQTQALMRELASRDLRAVSLANRTTDLLRGPGETSGEFGRQAWGTLINRPEIAALAGGSIFDFGLGVQNILRGGVSLDGTNVFRNDELGRMMTADVTNHLQRHFFTETGGARLTRTHGFDLTELGQISSFLGQRGAFAGMDLGTIEDGVVNVRPEAIRAMGSIVEDGAEMFRELRDLFGDRSIQELVQVAEQVTRENLGAPGAPAELANRLRNVRQQARASGMPELTVLEMQVQAADIFEQLGFGGRSSARMGAEVTTGVAFAERKLQEAQNAAAAAGRHFQAPSMPELVSQNIQAMASMASDFDMGPLAVAARMWDAGAFGDDPAIQDRVRSMISRGDIGGIEALTGVDLAGELHLRGGTARVMEGLSSRGLSLMTSGIQYELDERLPGAANRFLGEMGMLRGDERHDTLLRDTLLGFEAPTTEALITALTTGEGDIEDILTADMSLTRDEAARHVGYLERLDDEGRAAVGARIARARDAAADMDVFGVTRGTRRAAALETIASAEMLETAPTGPQDFVRQVLGRVLGSETETATAVMGILREEDRHRFSVEGEITQEDIDALERLGVRDVGRLAELGVGGDRAEMMHGLVELEGDQLRGLRVTDQSGAFTGEIDFARAEAFETFAGRARDLGTISKRMDFLLEGDVLPGPLRERMSERMAELGEEFFTAEPEDRDAILARMENLSRTAFSAYKDDVFDVLRLGDEDTHQRFVSAGGLDILQDKSTELRGRILKDSQIVSALDVLDDESIQGRRRARAMERLEGLEGFDAEDTSELRETVTDRMKGLEERLKEVLEIRREVAGGQGDDKAVLEVEIMLSDSWVGKLYKKIQETEGDL